MDRISTAIAGLDNILRGGFPCGSLILVSGGPGTGKTVLALQILFAHASPESRAVYFNTLGESIGRLIAFHEAFRFFTAERIGQGFLVFDLAEAIKGGDRTRLLAHIVRYVQEAEASLVAIDHFRVITEMLPDRASQRDFLVELGRNLTLLECTGLILGEYSLSEALACPEATMADGLLHLDLAADGASRTLRVLKMRGTDFVMGIHPFDIGIGGITVREELQR